MHRPSNNKRETKCWKVVLSKLQFLQSLGNPPSIYEKGLINIHTYSTPTLGSTSGGSNDKQSTAKTVVTQGHKTTALNIKLRSDYVPLKKAAN
ncbi:hypothetical protein KY284_023442 [Solanum tuberosum]|nr:hypothetical protein KY284_023442 [Solanum tuberosum]